MRLKQLPGASCGAWFQGMLLSDPEQKLRFTMQCGIAQFLVDSDHFHQMLQSFASPLTASPLSMTRNLIDEMLPAAK
jgi:hypothetical protein